MKLSLSSLLFIVGATASLGAVTVSAFCPRATTRATATATATSTSLDAGRRTALSNIAGVAVGFALAQQQAVAKLDTYLTEPTEEFKQNEAKAMEFKRAQLMIKAEFNKVLERFSTVSSTEEQIVDDLGSLKLLVVKTGGLPLGIKKEDLFKIIRRKKGSGSWTVPMEYAYQSLIREIAYQQSPNTEKDEANPL